jgi:tetratricopeptide (TPR) repeat protein
LAKAYIRLKDRESARVYSQKFAEVDSKDRENKELQEQIRSELQMGQALFKDGKLAEARDSLEEVVRLDPDNFMAHSYLVGIYGALNSPSLAHRHLVRLQEIEPEAFETHFLTATYLYRGKRAKEALEHALEAKQLQPGFADLRNLLGNIYYSLGDRSKAIEEYAAAVKLEPEREEFRINYESVAGSSEPQ